MLGISGYNLQCNNIIEGLTTKDEEQIKTTMADKTKLIVENLNISEARPNIEDTLTELSEFIKYGTNLTAVTIRCRILPSLVRIRQIP